MRCDVIIFRPASAGWGCGADCVIPKLAPHLPRRTNWRMKKKMSWRTSWMRTMSCICGGGGGCVRGIWIFPAHSSFCLMVPRSADSLQLSCHAFPWQRTLRRNSPRIPEWRDRYDEGIGPLVLDADDFPVGLEPILEVLFGHGLTVAFNIDLRVAGLSHLFYIWFI